jgi:tetratricopeptide (TPR) repeat protein
MNNIAVIEFASNNFDKAIELYERALKIVSNHYGENHIECTLYLNNLGSNYRSKGNTVKAMEYLKKALSIFEANKV